MKKKTPAPRPGKKSGRKRHDGGNGLVAAKPGFPIVGIGASAGGLEVFREFFRSMPAGSGMAFVIVSHLDPGHDSMLTEILQRTTAMPVAEAHDLTQVEPDHVYVIPPNRDMTVFHRSLRLCNPESPRGNRLPIDIFFRSLAEDMGENAIGVILSGTGSDGTMGLRAIVGGGGASFVQDPATAKYDGMPASAVRVGVATFVLPVEQMPKQLIAYVKGLSIQIDGVAAPPPAAGARERVLALIRSRTGHDFTRYKQSTVTRRIERRMAIHGITDAGRYARFVKERPEEVRLLFKELLINVTSFFRDPEAFAALRADILPLLFRDKPENYTFRVWVAGCATGEEAYSIAMLFHEYMGETGRVYKVQIYGTDIDDDSIAAARAAVYPDNIAIDVTPERLKRYFIREETGYRIRKEIRETVIFATQNAIQDPPFTRLDLVSCRNLLIYIEPVVQDRLIPMFHYALKPDGVLFLSPSESIGVYDDFFKVVSKKWKFFQAKPGAGPVRMAALAGPTWQAEHAGPAPAGESKKAKDAGVAGLARMALLQSYAPPSSAVTDETGNMMYLYGDTGRYLRPAPGQPTFNIVDMAREGLQMELRGAIRSAVSKNREVIIRDLAVKTNGGMHGVDISVRPLADGDAGPGMLLVSFLDAKPKTPLKRRKPARSAGRGASQRTEELEQELSLLREHLQSAVEELQASNEELMSLNEEHQSANEEFQSANEELQSTNEELETSREELQSVNEELVTVNAELQAKIEQLVVMQNDLKNLMENTKIGMIFLDDRLAIKRFTAQATRVFRLVESDVGRPLADIKSNSIGGEDLVDGARAVLDSLVPREIEMMTTDGDWLLARTMPYRTVDNVIEGVVLTFTDITKLKMIEESLAAAREYAESIVDTVREPLVVLDAGFRVVSASRSFYRTFNYSPDETIGRSLYDLGSGQWNLPRLRDLLEKILPGNSKFEDYALKYDFRGAGTRELSLNARVISGKEGTPRMILLAMENAERSPNKEDA